jgi:uncharacterized membrane protein YbaN (DUF454 family)
MEGGRAGRARARLPLAAGFSRAVVGGPCLCERSLRWRKGMQRGGTMAAMPHSPPEAPPPDEPVSGLVSRSRWARPFWLVAGALALMLGLIGIFLPLLPTTPFVLLGAFCFARGSARWEHWLVTHRRLGPIVRDWRQHRAVPLRAKQLATLMMTASSLWAIWAIPGPWRFAPAVCCAAVAWWLWRLPTRS